MNKENRIWVWLLGVSIIIILWVAISADIRLVRPVDESTTRPTTAPARRVHVEKVTKSLPPSRPFLKGMFVWREDLCG